MAPTAPLAALTADLLRLLCVGLCLCGWVAVCVEEVAVEEAVGCLRLLSWAKDTESFLSRAAGAALIAVAGNSSRAVWLGLWLG